MGAIRVERAVVALSALVFFVPLTTSGASKGPATIRTIRMLAPSESSTPVTEGSLHIETNRVPETIGTANTTGPDPREGTSQRRFSLTCEDQSIGEPISIEGIRNAPVEITSPSPSHGEGRRSGHLGTGEIRASRSTSVAIIVDQSARLAPGSLA